MLLLGTVNFSQDCDRISASCTELVLCAAMLFARTRDRRRSAAALRLHGVCGRRELQVAIACDATTHVYKIFVWRRLTPELSRAALRPRRWPNHSEPAPRPRSGLGLNELLGPPS